MDDLISKLSEIRSRYNCFNESEEPYYYALSEAIKLLSGQADGDTISRQAVKDWLLKWEGYIDKDIIARMQYRVIDIPSAQTEKRWIPVSERLPVYGEKCLVDFKLISGISHHISTSYCYVQKEGFWSDTPFQYKAIAWMPLPEPYGERKIE